MRLLRAELSWLALLPLLSLVACDQQTVYFCQEDGTDCASLLIDEINSASERLHVAIYLFNRTDIADALIAAHNRGVEVKVVVEGDEDVISGGTNYDVAQSLLEVGIEVRDDGNDAIMHHKFAVIDGHEVMDGSYNYTNQATLNNDENLMRLISTRTNEEFEAEFQRVWELATPSALADRYAAPSSPAPSDPLSLTQADLSGVSGLGLVEGDR